MKGDIIIDAMELIDPELIEDANQAPKKSVKYLKLRVGVAAACAILSLVMLVSIPLFSRDDSPGLPTVSTTPVTTDNKTDPAPTHIITPQLTPSPSPTPPKTPVILKEGVTCITIDINPSLKISVENDMVVSCEGVNDDGKALFGSIDVENIPFEMALTVIFESLITERYINNDTVDPVILLSAHGGDNASYYLETAARISAEVICQHNLSTIIVAQKVDFAITTARLADIYGISVGKMQYILNLIERKDNLSISQFAKLPIKVLFGIDLKNQSSSITGGYNEYGEKILMVKTANDQTAVIDWNQLSISEQNELCNAYSSLFPDEVEQSLPKP